MPFKSKAQVGKMAILEKEGKVKKGTFKEFAEATPSIKALPNKVKKRSNSMKKLPEHAKKKAKKK